MAELIKKYNFVIPIGYVCNVTSFVMQQNKRDSAYIFDRAGSSMWAVSELVKNNFEDFLNIDNIIPMKLYDNSEKMYLVDKKYYFRITMPIHSSKEDLIKHNIDKSKHKDRFVNLINTTSDKSVLFIRFEEPSITEDGNRIIYEEYSEKFKFDELYYLKKFSDSIKEKNSLLNFKILFIHSNKEIGNFTDVDRNIIGIMMKNECDYKDPFVSKKVVQTFDFHRDFLLQNL